MISKVSNSDYWGALASLLCLVHCLITPLLFVVQTCSVSCCADTPSWWQWFDYFFLFISFVAVYRTNQTTSIEFIKPIFWLAWIALLIAIVNEQFGWIPLQRGLVYVPGLLLIGLHFYNLKYCECEADKCCTEYVQEA